MIIPYQSYIRNINGWEHLPRSGGIYFIVNYLGNIVYIGETKNLFKRINDYKIVEKIFFIKEESRQDRLKLECRLIKEYAPIYNTQHNIKNKRLNYAA